MEAIREVVNLILVKRERIPAIHDPNLLYMMGKFIFIIKDHPKKQEGGTLIRAQGVAIAENPLGPFCEIRFKSYH